MAAEDQSRVVEVGEGRLCAADEGVLQTDHRRLSSVCLKLSHQSPDDGLATVQRGEELCDECWLHRELQCHAV